jgi:hypothetical protein
MHGDVNASADATENRHRLRDHVGGQIRVVAQALAV